MGLGGMGGLSRGQWRGAVVESGRFAMIPKLSFYIKLLALLPDTTMNTMETATAKAAAATAKGMTKARAMANGKGKNNRKHIRKINRKNDRKSTGTRTR